MTPCEKKGYKVGDEFKIVGGTTFSEGSIVSLFEDDGSSSPNFKLISGYCEYNNCDGECGGYHSIEHVKPLKKQQKTKRYTKYLERKGYVVTPPKKQEHDMSDPRNWRKGDLVMRDNQECLSWWTSGKIYQIVGDASGIFIPDNDGDLRAVATVGSRFKFHSRPSK